jgi:hypothetical protein
MKALELHVQPLCEYPGPVAEGKYGDDALSARAGALVAEIALSQATERAICLLDAHVDVLVVFPVSGGDMMAVEPIPSTTILAQARSSRRPKHEVRRAVVVLCVVGIRAGVAALLRCSTEQHCGLGVAVVDWRLSGHLLQTKVAESLVQQRYQLVDISAGTAEATAMSSV